VADEPLLAYQTPRPQPRIVIERFSDGGVTVTMRLNRMEEVWAAIRIWVVAGLACVVVGWLVSHYFGYISGAMLLVVAALVGCLGVIVVKLWRWTEPTVIGISPRGVYVDRPSWIFRRQRRFRREEVVVSQPVTYPVIKRNGPTGELRHFLEVQFKHGLPLFLLDGSDRDEVIAVSSALRQALGWDPPPPPLDSQSLNSSSSG
jgi:hypothetical protein